MNIAIIGYGGIGRYHFHRIKQIDCLNVKGVYDIDNERMLMA